MTSTSPKRNRGGRLALALVALGVSIAGAGCRPDTDGFGIYRVIDHLESRDVVQSPLKNPDPGNAALAEIVDREALEDLGTGTNPFLIKKKLHVGLFDFNALAAVPPTEILFRLRIPEGARFEFQPAIRFDPLLFRAEEGAREATFSVFVADGDRETAVFRKTLVLGPRTPLKAGREKVDLSPYAGRRVTIRLMTSGDGQALAFWISPMIYRVRRDPRYVILISLDTLRADHLGCYGYGRDTSPHIDALARDGVLFRRTIAASSWTLPSHVSLITGLDAANHGVVAPEFRLGAEIPTLAEALKSRGFFNAAFTGGGFASGFFGFSRGFDRFQVVGQVTSPDAAGRLAKAAAGLIESTRDRDLFLFLHTYQIHAPFGPDKPYNTRYLEKGAAFDAIDTGPLRINFEKRYAPLPPGLGRNIVDLYDAEIRYTDEALIGFLVRRLKALGIYDRTMIIVTSDHGEEFFEHHGWLHSHSVYDEVARVPLVVKFFGSRHAGRAVDELARGVDVMPTICRELGVRALADSLDGRSLLDAAAGRRPKKAKPVSGLCSQASAAMDKHAPAKTALIVFPHKFIWNAPYSAEDLAYYGGFPPPWKELEIFDLSRDPGETTDLTASRPDLVRKLRDLMTGAPAPRKPAGTRKAGIDDEIEKQLKTLGYL